MNNCARRGGLDKSATSAFRTDPRGTPQAFCVREPDGRLIAREAGESLQYYFFDLLGSTILMAPATEGNPTDTLYYTPWGETVTSGSRASTVGTAANPYRYVGSLGYYTHHQDANLADWMQLGVRFYDPELGRFERRDPVPYALQDYWYSLGRPLVLVDPSGEWSQCVGFSVGAGLVVGRGGLAGWGILRCHDACSGWRTLWYGYVCSCLGAYAGVSFNITPCILRQLTEESANTTWGGGWEFGGGSLSFSGTGVCAGAGLGLEFGFYRCHCRIEGMFL